MAWIQTLYASQPFWLWLTIGVVLLAVEAMATTEWLLWPAVAAGVVAAVTAVFRELGLPLEAGLFAVLTIGMTLASRRLVKRVNPAEAPDINDQGLRLIGSEARVVEPFVNGHGRIFVSGSEWPADSQGLALELGQKVLIESVDGSRIKVRPL